MTMWKASLWQAIIFFMGKNHVPTRVSRDPSELDHEFENNT